MDAQALVLHLKGISKIKNFPAILNYMNVVLIKRRNLKRLKFRFDERQSYHKLHGSYYDYKDFNKMLNQP